MKGETICEKDPGTGKESESETKQPGVKRNNHPSFYENAETEDIKVLSSEKDEEKFYHSRPSPSARDKSQTKLASQNGLASLRGQEINRRKCSINEHLLSEEEKARMEREFPFSDEKNLEVTETEVIPETLQVDRTSLSKGTEKITEPTCAVRARQMKLDWLNGKSTAGINYYIYIYYLRSGILNFSSSKNSGPSIMLFRNC